MTTLPTQALAAVSAAQKSGASPSNGIVGRQGASPSRKSRARPSVADITGLGRDEHQLALARDLGADRAINLDGANQVEWALATTDGAGVDCVVEYSAFRRAVDTINSRQYPMARRRPHSFPIEPAAPALATRSGAAGVPSIHVAIVPRP